MMMAILCFLLTLPPRSELLELQSSALPPEGAPPLSQNVYAPVIRHCGRPEDMCIFIFSFVNTNSYQVLLQIQVMDYQTGAARYPCCLPES